jgi:hypothetical protein
MFKNRKSKSHKLIINSATVFNMPDLWHRTGNSLNVFSDQLIGVGFSENNSQFAKGGLPYLAG